MPPAFTVLLIVVFEGALLSIPAAGIMKFFVRQLPYRTHFGVFLWAFFRSAFVFLVVPLIAALSGRIDAAAYTGAGGAFTLIGAGWLITRGLRAYGVPGKFPGTGAKTIASLFVLLWAIVGLAYVISLVLLRAPPQ